MEKFYITTSIPYVNDKLHIGHALEFAQADAVARYTRLTGKEVYFSTGSDEHGAKIMRSAESKGKNVREFVDENAANVKAVLLALNISNNDFIRTSDEKRHFPSAQKLWKELEEAGDIYKSSYKGLYCVGHEAFVTEKDLVNGVCPDHGKAPELIEEENYFFRLSKYTDEIKKKIESGELKIIPESKKNEILSLLKSGLEDISFSRPAKDLPWGIPVPRDATQTMYVWCDALVNYISALGYGQEDSANFQKFWPADLHVIGKDILRFHSAIWPAMLLSAGLPLPRAIFVHGFVSVDGQKMSKSLGNVINPLDFVEKFGSDPVRFYLLSEIPAFEDGDLSLEKFKEAYNGVLAGGIGNLTQRTAKMIGQYFNNEILKPNDDLLISVPVRQKLNFFKEANENSFEFFSLPYIFKNFTLLKYKEAMENFEFNKAINHLLSFSSQMDKYIEEYKPFKLIKEDSEKTAAVLWNLAYGITGLAVLLQPFMPETADKILSIFGNEGLKELNLNGEFIKNLDEKLQDFKIKSELLTPLFPKIE